MQSLPLGVLLLFQVPEVKTDVVNGALIKLPYCLGLLAIS